jgi:hypothetical protein
MDITTRQMRTKLKTICKSLEANVRSVVKGGKMQE